MGEAKEDINGDMDAFQAQTGVPVIFIEASLETMADAYEALGQITGETEQAAACAAIFGKPWPRRGAVRTGSGQRAQAGFVLPGRIRHRGHGRGQRPRQVLDYAAAVNVAVLDSVASEGGNEVSMEQIYLWDPGGGRSVAGGELRRDFQR